MKKNPNVKENLMPKKIPKKSELFENFSVPLCLKKLLSVKNKLMKNIFCSIFSKFFWAFEPLRFQLWRIYPKTPDHLEFLQKIEENGDVKNFSNPKKTPPNLQNFLRSTFGNDRKTWTNLRTLWFRRILFARCVKNSPNFDSTSTFWAQICKRNKFCHNLKGQRTMGHGLGQVHDPRARSWAMDHGLLASGPARSGF